MDPASILGVIGVAAQLLKLLNDYGNAVAEYRDEVAGLRVELFCLKSALTQIERDTLSSPDLQSDEFSTMLEEARVLLVVLTGSLQPEVSRAQRLAQRLQWPLRRQQVKDTTARLERIKTYFILVATNDLRDANRIFSTSLSSIQQSLTELKISEENKANQAAVNTWLSPFDPGPMHRAALAARSEGTNNWFLDGVLKNWAKSSVQLLWLRGKPGSGKTCIAAACTTRLTKTHDKSHVAYFYCSYNSAESQKARTVLASLLKQLADQDPNIQRDMIQTYHEDLKAQHGSASSVASLSVLSQLAVRNCADTSRDVFFVIDAVDEGGEGSTEILKMIFSIAHQCSRARVVLTSTESMTEHVIKTSDEMNISSMDVNINPANVNDDIELYVHTLFSKDNVLAKLRPQLQDQIKDKIRKDHNGSFRWVQCTLDDLSCLATPKAIKNALESITPSLSNIYKSVISSIPQSISGICRFMLVCLVSALRPLTLDELAEAAMFLSSADFDEEDRLLKKESVISHLRCLVRYEPTTRRVQLAHSSVRDFLVSPEKSGDFHIDYITADQALCRVCVRYLVLPAFQGPCPDIRELAQRREEWPFLGYATERWIDHVRLVGPATMPDDVKATILELFGSAEEKDGGNFAAWYQCMYPQRGAKVWETKPLYICAREGLVGLLRIMLPTITKEQLEQRGGSRGSTALHVAAAFGEVEAVQVLLEAGADPHERNDHGENGMQWAWFWGHMATVRALLEGGADPALIEWEPNLDQRTDEKWEAAAVILRDLQRRRDLGQEDNLESLPMHLASLMSPHADEQTLQRLRVKLVAQDFKIPPRAQLRPSPHSDQLDTILKNHSQ